MSAGTGSAVGAPRVRVLLVPGAPSHPIAPPAITLVGLALGLYAFVQAAPSGTTLVRTALGLRAFIQAAPSVITLVRTAFGLGAVV